MKTIATLFILSLVFGFGSAFAANALSLTFATQFLHPSDWSFEENRGQIADPSGNALPEIKFFGSFAGAQVYCTSQKISIVFTKKTPIPFANPATKKVPI